MHLKRIANDLFYCHIAIAFMLVGCRLAGWSEEMPSNRNPVAVRQVGTIAAPALIETSGLTYSHREPDLLWAINDGGSPAVLFALRTDGSHLGSVVVEGADNIDWEDMAGFEWQGQHFILIADIGDNLAVRDTVDIYVVVEPVRRDTGAFPSSVAVEWQFQFRYEDGPRDCESVGVDADRQEILLITKRTSPPQLYRLPLRPATDATTLIAKRMGKVTGIPPPTMDEMIFNPRFGVLQSQPTALDIRTDNRQILVLTYKNAYLFSREQNVSWADVLTGEPRTILLPRLKQKEAAAYSPNGHTVYVTTEGRSAPLLEIDLAGFP